MLLSAASPWHEDSPQVVTLYVLIWQIFKAVAFPDATLQGCVSSPASFHLLDKSVHLYITQPPPQTNYIKDKSKTNTREK